MADSYVIRQGTERNTNPMFMEIMAKDLTELATYASKCTPGSLGYLEDATVYRLGTQGTWVKVGEDVPSRLNTLTSQLADKANQLHLTEKTGYGVISGLVISAQTTPDMTMKSSAGVAYMADGTRYSLAAVPSIAVTTANETNPRIDIVYLSSAGVVSYLAGTAAATPAAPVTPEGGLLLAEISVAANQTTIAAANIASRKKGLWTEDWIYPTLLNSWVSESAAQRIKYTKDATGMVRIQGICKSGTNLLLCTLPVGFRPNTDVYSQSVCQATLYTQGYSNIIMVQNTGNVYVYNYQASSTQYINISYLSKG